MNKEEAFAQALQSVKALAREQGNRLGREQVMDTFQEQDLNTDQMEMVYDYLRQNKIGIDEDPKQEILLSKEETDYLQDYLEQLAVFSQITLPEREAVTLAAMEGDPAAIKKLIEIYLPRVVEIARLYAGQGVLLGDLIGEGNIALTAAASEAAKAAGCCEVDGFLGKQIMDAMERLILDAGRCEESDRELVERINEIADKAAELSGLLDRKVEVEELSAESGYTPEEIREVILLSGGMDTINL